MTAMLKTVRADGYILGSSEAEAERLRIQAMILEAAPERMLRQAGVAPGMRVLDAGCGTGEGMRVVGRIVGPAGHVTGLEIDAAMGRRTETALLSEEGPRYDVVAGDVMSGDPVPGAPFDVVFARLLLCHMTDPAGAVRRLAALARPGGRLVLLDYDMSRMAIRPEHPAFDRGCEMLTECFRRTGKDADAGLRLAAYMAAAELPEPDGCDIAPCFGRAAEIGHRLDSVLASLSPAIRALGIADPAEVETVRAEIRAVIATGGHLMLAPSLIGVWTTVPG